MPPSSRMLTIAALLLANAFKLFVTGINGKLLSLDSFDLDAALPRYPLKLDGDLPSNQKPAVHTEATVLNWPTVISFGYSAAPDRYGGVTVAGGWYHACAIMEGGLIDCWGIGYWGSTKVPLAATLGDPISVACAGNWSMVATADGGIHTWGDSEVPAVVQVPDNILGITMVAAGLFHGMALDKYGQVTLWGDNSAGQITPPELATSNVVKVSAGLGHSMALTSTGQVIAWGYNKYGQATVPIAAQSDVIDIAAGFLSSWAVKRDGSIIQWGDTFNGQLTVPPGITNATAIAAGLGHAVAIVNGGAVTWGSADIIAPPQAQVNITGVVAGLLSGFAIKAPGPEHVPTPAPGLTTPGATPSTSTLRPPPPSPGSSSLPQVTTHLMWLAACTVVYLIVTHTLS